MDERVVNWGNYDWSQPFGLTERRISPPSFLEGYVHTRGSEIRWRILNMESVFIGGPIRYWPPEIQRLAIQDHLNNLERRRLVLFYMFNGMSPSMTLQHMLYGGRVFDASARRHIDLLIERAFSYNYTYYDMLLCSWSRKYTVD